MPIEVGEIGISMHVAGENSGMASRRGEAMDACASEQEQEKQEDLIEECVRRVLSMLRAERER